MDNQLSPIQSFYAGKIIFISGGTGFMGKVLVEKLLYSCSDLKKIYIILRSKRGRSPENRIEDMFRLPMFERIRKTKPEVMKKLIGIPGDIINENLGLTNAQRDLLINEVEVIFHVAATLKLEATLKDAIDMNTVGTASMLELAKNMKKLQAFIHLSTAFCHVDQEELNEHFYESSDDPNDVMKMVKWMNPEALKLATPELLKPHPNTYTYSKRLAETLVMNEYPNLPCAIVRPSIVTPAWAEPLPGWVDSLNGPVGIIVGAGKGVIRSMHCNGEYMAQVIPVDLAINALIAIGYKIGMPTTREKSIPVYNVTQSGVVPITWRQVVERGKKIAHAYPFEAGIWYPDGDIRSSKYIHNIFVFFFHILPAYFIDFLMLIFRQKRFMVRLQKRISDGLEMLQFFTTRDWRFHNTNLLKLWEKMSPQDKKIFSFDFLAVDETEYMKKIILGARQYCMKESLDTLPRARIAQKMLWILHNVVIYGFYYMMLSMVIRNFEWARVSLNFLTQQMKLLPIIGDLVAKIAPM